MKMYRQVRNKRLAILLAALCVALSVLAVTGCMFGTSRAGKAEKAPAPIDPQKVLDQDDMTWDDYHPIPGVNWADPEIKPTERTIRIAVVVADFNDQPFVITLPKHSDMFGNPQIDPIDRSDVARFYADFWNKPQEINRGHTVNEYWMEQSHGRIGVEFDAYGPYRMPQRMVEYSGTVNRPRGESRGSRRGGDTESANNESQASRGEQVTDSQRGDRGNSNRGGAGRSASLTGDLDAMWRQDAGDKEYDLVLRIYAGYDETCVWQEFGEMKFQTRDDVPQEWGNPENPNQRWSPTRYIEWTSWKAGSYLWSNSSIINGECSGSIRHEISHAAFRIGDNNNNPYVQPYRRVGSGPWDIMDRGSFNGPGGPHNRWEIPVTQGGAMPAGLMLRQMLYFGFVTQEDTLMLNRDDLAKSGLVVAKVTAREVVHEPDAFAGITVTLDGQGDLTPPDDPATNPLSSGTPNFNFYSMEVVQQMGYDSFCPDSGVLISKSKDRASSNGGPNAFSCFDWVIDAHPEDINMVDFKRPNGEVVMRTIADYRQLNDALFHAGLNSGSQFEYEDIYNRLHFYVINIQKNEQGVLSYVLGVRSLDGSGPQLRGAELTAPDSQNVGSGYNQFDFTLTNTGQAVQTDPNLHWRDFRDCLTSDIYRLSVSVEGEGWSAKLLNALATLKFGESKSIPVFVSREKGNAASAIVILQATSESDPTRAAIAKLTVKKR